MAYAEIDIKHLRNAIDAILNHIVEDLDIEKLPIDEDQYWDIAGSEIYNISKNPGDFSIGSLVDDIAFSRKIRRGESYDSPINIMHIWPQLRYVLEKLKASKPSVT